MKLNEWFIQAKEVLDEEELQHLNVHKGKIQLQLKNPVTKEIEIHDFTYTAKEAENLEVT